LSGAATSLTPDGAASSRAPRPAKSKRGGRADPQVLVLSEPPHAMGIAELMQELGVSSAEGLTREEADERRARWGANVLPEQPKDPAWRRLLAQFTDPLVLTLLGAAGVAVAVGMSGGHAGSWLSRFADAIAILLIVVLNALIGFFQEKRAEAALDALKKLAAPQARVRRASKVMIVPAADVVPGDLLELEAGDAVAADARVMHAMDLATEESALTGESQPTGKDPSMPLPPDAPLGDRLTMVYTGTMVVRGRGRALVTGTGAQTELGRIGAMIASIGDQKTPLEERLEAFGKVILWVCLATSGVLLAWGFARPLVFGGEPRVWHAILLEAVALAVAAIPEGLPAITTITLALGMQRMARRGAIVRKLPAVETLGAATVICSDKTGTLTQNEMTVREIYTHGRHFTVTGQGYDPAGEILDEEGRPVAGESLPGPLDDTLHTAALCNNARLRQDDEDGRWSVVGDPTEGALLALAEKGERAQHSVRQDKRTVAELPFDGDRKRMTVVTRDAQGREIVHVKGSADVLLPLCEHYETDEAVLPLSETVREEILREAERMSRKALRVLAFCRRDRPGVSSRDETDEPPSLAGADAETLERELTFLGLVGMMDPPRQGVREAVATCAAAGIRAVMITGDHRLTATAIAEEIGLWEPGDKAITGAELAKLSEADLDDEIMSMRVFARTTAEQKLQLVRAFKRKGHVVAMTGDGVNDAPALREANIGVAMGRTGTDVARQAADLVITDDNFATIVDAVREGRAIYRNIQKFIFFLLSANMGLVVAVFTVSFVTKWPALTPLMVLWINLVTNGLPALALGVDPPDRRLMEEPPRPRNEGLMVLRDYVGILYVGGVMGGAAVLLYALGPQDDASLVRTRALAFTLLALSPLIHALSCRSPIRSAFQSRPLVSVPLVLAMAASAAIHLVAVMVPALQPVFRTHSPSASEWLLGLGLAAAVLPAVEIIKLLNRRRLERMGLGPPPSSILSRQ
jgi:Ca2+-transporting ATPase